MIRAVLVLGVVGIVAFEMQTPVPNDGPVCIHDYCVSGLPAVAIMPPALRLAEMKEELRAAPPPLVAVSVTLLPRRRRPKPQDQ